MEFLLTLLPPLLWASATLTDKMLVSGGGDDAKPGALMAISGFFNLLFGTAIILPLLSATGGIRVLASLDAATVLPLLLNGATQTAAMILFLRAITLEEVSRVDPWFQTIPAFGIVLAYGVIGERLVWYQWGAIVLLAVGGWVIKSEGAASWRVVLYMVAASFLLALNDTIFARFGREVGGGLWPAIFCDVMGKAVCGLVLLLGPRTRRGFVVGLRTKFRLQTVSEVLFIAADFLFDRAKLLAPVAIVQGIACSQPVFTLLGAALLTRLAPRLIREEQGIAFWRKFGGIALIVAGGAVLATTR